MKKFFLALCLSLSTLFALPVLAEVGEQALVTVNINAASAAEIAEVLNGVGESKAQAIVQYRDEHGPFESVEDITQVRGIGESTLANNADRIVLE